MIIEMNNIHRYLEKLHKDILIVMDEVDRICVEYNLQYYLMCGSCLGAVRHKGFIPWDDDLDIAMPREDFDRFISLLDSNSNDIKGLNKRIYLRWVTTEKYYNQDFAKICLKGTVFKEDNGISSQTAGIFVDVFPLDRCIAYCTKIEKRSKIYNHLHSCLYLKGAERREMDWKIKHWPRNFISYLLPNTVIYKMMLSVVKSCVTPDANYQAFFSTPYPIKRQIFPISWHAEGKRMDFEKRKYVCPKEAEKLMCFIYGDNYMELPPINKRKTHSPIRVVFSDGEEFCFQNNKSEIQYEDLLD